MNSGNIVGKMKAMVSRQFTAVYKRSGKWVTAWVEEIPGVNTQGRTKKEAKENLAEALLLILETSRKLLKKKEKSGSLSREVLTVMVPA